MAVNGFDRPQQLALCVRFHEAANSDLRCAGVVLSGREQRRDAFLPGVARELDPSLLLPQTHVAEHEMYDFTLEDIHGLIEIVDGRDDLVTGVAEEIFIVEGGQRLVLDDEDPLDDLLTLPEQHLSSTL